MASTIEKKPVICYQRRSKSSHIVNNHAEASDPRNFIIQEDDEDKSLHQILSACIRRKRIRNVKTVLPQDLIHAEILPRLPAKYVVRFLLVCKSWNSLFSTSAFVNSHLSHQLHQSEEKDRFIVKCFSSNGAVNILSHTSSIRVDKVPCVCLALFGSINGLILMATQGGRFCLWNPAMGHVKFFDSPPPHLHPKKDACNSHWLNGFCWDHVQNDYKLLMFCTSIFTNQICIYSTNSGTWTRIPLKLMLPKPIFGFSSRVTPVPSTIVKGTPYWSYCKYLTLPGKKHAREIFSAFKFAPETNELKYLPDLDSLNIRGNNFKIVNIKDRLVGMAYTFLVIKHGKTPVDMYCLDEDSDNAVWSKMYTIGPVYLDRGDRLSQSFRNGGEILISGNFGPYAFYDPKTKNTKRIAKNTRKRLHEQGYSYTPSLVCVRGMESMQNFATKED